MVRQAHHDFYLIFQKSLQFSSYESVEWDTRQSGIGNGVYFYRLEATSINRPSKPYIQVTFTVIIIHTQKNNKNVL